MRPGIRTVWSLTPVFCAGVLRAAYLFPQAGPAKFVVAGLREMGLIVYVFRGGFAGTLVGRVISLETSILYYALLAWRAKPEVPAGARGFGTDQLEARGDLLSGMAIASLMEIVPVHLLIARWTPSWAWVATGLSLYGAVWLTGLARSIELRPTLVGEDYVEVRNGLLFRLHIPGEAIAEIAGCRIELSEPLQAERLFCARRKMKSVTVTADDASAFETALRAMLNSNAASGCL